MVESQGRRGTSRTRRGDVAGWYAWTVLLRQLEYLTALARERHFARAAAACHVSQPSLSAGIAKLESELKVAIVVRGRRFGGFTPKGDRVVAWARQILADRDALQAELASLRTGAGRRAAGVRDPDRGLCGFDAHRGLVPRAPGSAGAAGVGIEP